MRQAGVVAAAGLYALDHNVERLADDHRCARRLAEGLSVCRGVEIEPERVQTNIVVFRLTDEALAESLLERLRERRILILRIGPLEFRAVTHLDVTARQIDGALEELESVLGRRA